MNVKQVGLFITLLLIIVSIVMALPASKTEKTQNQQIRDPRFLLPIPFPIPIPIRIPEVPLKEVSLTVPDFHAFSIAGIPFLRGGHRR
ncbi:UNVERIFIED_CONTAM: hypothetical protein RMT77_019914 [Armadillidium vulgare]